MIVINGVNTWQLTDSADGTPQTKTPEQQVADGWPPPPGTPILKADKGTGYIVSGGSVPETVP